ncbi:dual specificity protein phosphatase family protein [Haloglomus halophilum]|uniref:dual specificity protein phosphatase family protein n=1 Tax=Haloglomus halophilum TaxID=2962672 RepID=UPI0020C9F455|nr:dual specificity protein phosphatase [Haloglomus halophilum]
MHQVADGLYVGGIAAVSETAPLRDADIEVVVGLTHDPPAGGYPDPVRVIREPMVDGPRNEAPAFERAVEATRDALTSDERALVHCSAGASRSVAVAAAALTETTDRDLEAAFQRVVDRRPPADPHPALVRRAAGYLGYES